MAIKTDLASSKIKQQKAVIAEPKPVIAARPAVTKVPAKVFSDVMSNGKRSALRARAAAQLNGLPTVSTAPTLQPIEKVKATNVSAPNENKPPVAAPDIDIPDIDPNNVSVSGNKSTEFPKEFQVKGVDLKFTVGANATVTASASSDDGFDTYTVGTDVNVTVGASAGVDPRGATGTGASASYQQVAGVTSNYTVKLPKGSGVDPRQANPYDPSKLPVGGSVTVDGSQYVNTEFEASFTRLAATFSSETHRGQASGYSYSVTKVANEPQTVRVAAGPTQSVNGYDGLGLSFGVGDIKGGVKVGNTTKVEDADIKTVDFNLSTPEGKAAYQHFLVSGELPTAEGAGVSNVQSQQKRTFSSETTTTVTAGDEEHELPLGGSNGGTQTTTTTPSGAKTIETEVDYGTSGGTKFKMVQEFDESGKEDVSKRRYEYAVTPRSAEEASRYSSALAGKRTEKYGTIEVGKPVTLVMTEAQMQHLHQTTQANQNSNQANFAVRNAAKEQTPYEMALWLARNPNLGDNLFSMADIGAPGTALKALPIEIKGYEFNGYGT